MPAISQSAAPSFPNGQAALAAERATGSRLREQLRSKTHELDRLAAQRELEQEARDEAREAEVDRLRDDREELAVRVEEVRMPAGHDTASLFPDGQWSEELPQHFLLAKPSDPAGPPALEDGVKEGPARPTLHP